VGFGRPEVPRHVKKSSKSFVKLKGLKWVRYQWILSEGRMEKGERYRDLIVFQV